MKKIKADRFVSIVSILISQTILVTFAQFSDFCQQNALTTIFQFDNSIYFHHLNWFWRWNYRLNQKKPIKDDRLPILFYGGLSSSLTAFDFASKFIRTGFTGFLIPEKIGNFENGDFLLAARNFDGVIFGQKNSSNGHYYVYYPRIWDRSSISAKENPFFHELKTLISIDNSTNTVRTLHYDRKHRELYVAFEYKLMRQSSIVSYDLTLRNIQRMEKEKKIYFSRFITEVVGFWDDQFYHEHNTTMMIYGKNSISILKEDHNVELTEKIKPLGKIQTLLGCFSNRQSKLFQSKQAQITPLMLDDREIDAKQMNDYIRIINVWFAIINFSLICAAITIKLIRNRFKSTE